MLFSEPKIPQFATALVTQIWNAQFQCSSASRKFLNSALYSSATGARSTVSVLFSEPKIPQFMFLHRSAVTKSSVSVLFSEPKIPQSLLLAANVRASGGFQCSSASRKFLNFSARTRRMPTLQVSVLFSEPKIPQWVVISHGSDASACFSALQRAENSSINEHSRLLTRMRRFSALQRAENSSIPFVAGVVAPTLLRFSALQRAENSSILRSAPDCCRLTSFSALQRAENSSMDCRRWRPPNAQRFQCSSASRKFLNMLLW